LCKELINLQAAPTTEEGRRREEGSRVFGDLMFDPMRKRGAVV
jgi:hypothetical protein